VLLYLRQDADRVEKADGALFEIVRLLAEYGADISQKNTFGQTALHLLALAHPGRSAEEAAHVILGSPGGDDDSFVNAVDAWGNTAIHYAATRNDHGLLELFLSHGLDLDLRDTDGNQAIHLAARWGYGDACRVLIDRGCSVDVRNWAALTPFGVARFHLQHEIVHILQTHFSKKGGEKVEENFLDSRAAAAQITTIARNFFYGYVPNSVVAAAYFHEHTRERKTIEDMRVQVRCCVAVQKFFRAGRARMALRQKRREHENAVAIQKTALRWYGIPTRNSIYLYFVGILTYAMRSRMNEGSSAVDIAARQPPLWSSRRRNDRAKLSRSICLATPGCGGAGRGGGWPWPVKWRGGDTSVGGQQGRYARWRACRTPLTSEISAFGRRHGLTLGRQCGRSVFTRSMSSVVAQRAGARDGRNEREGSATSASTCTASQGGPSGGARCPLSKVHPQSRNLLRILF